LYQLFQGIRMRYIKKRVSSSCTISVTTPPMIASSWSSTFSENR
jgi:hypothetical protein